MSASRKLKTAIIKIHDDTHDTIQLSLLNNVYYALDHLEEKDSESNHLEAPALFDKLANDIIKYHPYANSAALSEAYARIKAALLKRLDVIPAKERLQFALSIQHHHFDGDETNLISRLSYDLDHSFTDAHHNLSAGELFDAFTVAFINSYKDDQAAYLKHFEARVNIEAAVKKTAKQLENFSAAEAKQLALRAEQEAVNQANQAQATHRFITSQHLFGKTIPPKNIFQFPTETDLSMVTTESNHSESSKNPLSPKSP